jgi:hypothetical protein
MARGRTRTPCWRERRKPRCKHDGGICGEECAYERTVVAMLDALEAHGDETGCDVSSFIVPYECADCVCAACGTVVYEGPEFETDA